MFQGSKKKEKVPTTSKDKRNTRKILFLTDFGVQDEYVGVVKCVIKSISPDTEIIDLTHEIHSHDIYHALFVIQKSFNFFPDKSVLLAVVDPGVGGKRKGIFGISRQGRREIMFVGPDNGIFTPLYTGEYTSYEIDSRKVREKAFEIGGIELPMSSTFHGRDIFAPTAALLSIGVSPEEISSGRIEKPKKLAFPNWRLLTETDRHKAIEGYVAHIDKFGNIITNIPSSEVKGKIKVRKKRRGEMIIKRIEFSDPEGRRKIELRNIPFVSSYEDVERGEPLLISGSWDTVEFSVREGNAKEYLRRKLKFDVSRFCKVVLFCEYNKIALKD